MFDRPSRRFESMPHDILNSMRALREDMRQRLLQVPEYRALVALDHSIDEICVILQETLSVAASPPAAPEPVAPPQAAIPQAVMPQAVIPEAAPPRPSAIASAFAETLAAKIDQRNGARTSTYQPASRVLAG
jgi:hypothetical protein